MALIVFNIMVGIALVLAVVALIKPAAQLIPIAVFLVCVALLVGKNT